jgi:hypothetical protein
MKKILLPLLFFAVSAISTAQTPRVNRTLMTQVERDLDQRIFRIWNDNPMAVVGTTRGVYLQGYGIIFTVEMNMVTPPGGGLMGSPLTEDLKVEVHKKKVQRLPELKTALKDILVAVASQLDPIPANEQIVVAAILPRYTWEAAEGVPIQLTAQGMKSDLLAMRSGGGQSPGAKAETKINAKSTRIPTGAAAKSAPAPVASADAIKFSELN